MFPIVGACVGVVGDLDFVGDAVGVIDVGCRVVGGSVPVGVNDGNSGA